MDEGPALVDTIVWEATGKQASSGQDALEKMGMSEDEARDYLDDLYDSLDEIGGENCAERSEELPANSTLKDIAITLEGLYEDADGDLNDIFQGAIEEVKQRLHGRRLGPKDWSPHKPS